LSTYNGNGDGGAVGGDGCESIPSKVRIISSRLQAGRHAAHNNTNMPAQICQSSTRRYMRRRSAVPIHACRARKPECQLYRDISGRRNRCTRSTSPASRLSLVFTLPPYLPKSSARHGSNICDTLSLVHNTRTRSTQLLQAVNWSCAQSSARHIDLLELLCSLLIRRTHSELSRMVHELQQ